MEGSEIPEKQSLLLLKKSYCNWKMIALAADINKEFPPEGGLKKGTYMRLVKLKELPKPSKEELEELNKITEEEVHKGALEDPDCPPLTQEQLDKMEKVK